MGQSKGSKKSKGRNKREFKCCHECGKFGLGVRSREASVFEASKRSLAEARCVDMVNVDLNVLEMGAVLLFARSRKIQVGIDSCAGVNVFVHLRCFETKSCKPCVDLSARKVKGKFRGVPFWYACLKMAETCEVLAALVAVSESDMSHDGFSPCYDEDTQACAYHEGRGAKLELELNGVFEVPVMSRSLFQQSNSATFRIAINDERRRQCSFHKMRRSAYFRHFGFSELAIAIIIPSISFRSESDEFKLELPFFSVV